MKTSMGLHGSQPNTLANLGWDIMSALASLKLTCVLLVALALLTLAGAWIPQASETDQTTLLLKFGTEGYALLSMLGLTDVFHSAVFLTITAALLVNLIACTSVRMVPRLTARINQCDFLDELAIKQLPVSQVIKVLSSTAELQSHMLSTMTQRGFKCKNSGNSFIFEKGRLGLLAAPMTHIGLLVLLLGVCTTALGGYRGNVFLTPGQSIAFPPDNSTKPRVGKMPAWSLHLDSTYKETYTSGEPKQWYSTLTLLDKSTKKLAHDTIWVNHPMNFHGVEFYQSDWSVRSVRLTLAGESQNIPVKDMGGESMGVLPLLPDVLLIVALHNPQDPARLYLKQQDSTMPRKFATLASGQTFQLGKLKITYEGATVVTGIQYKYDPGLPIIYTSFLFLMLGAMFVATPHLMLYANITASTANSSSLTLGHLSGKFRGLLNKEINRLETELTRSTEVTRC
ncbi:MAG: cytochrome c biogenesis protein ResB [Candidatus Melainabacteria bacterium]|nr:cytochrome c biogenesis protein ResB [Candidatus Melainabacteria bacterium]